MRSKKLISFHARVVKDINEQLVLKLIQENEIIASSDLAKITGMRPSTIFNILKELSAKSFVLFYGKGDSTSKGGKKPYMWTLNKDAAYVIGLDIEVGEMSLVVLNFKGELIYKRNIKIDTVNTVDELADGIITAINLAIDDNKLEHSKILGVGIAFAGIVDCRRGVVVMSSILPDLNFNLLEKLNVFPFKILLENNANAVAVGYKWKNNVKARKNYLTILIEIDKHVSGLGIGIVINGELYRGSSYCAGELYPHLPTLKEILASYRSRFPEGKILKNYMNSFDSIDIELVLQAAKEGDEIARLIFSKIGSIVGQTIAPAVSLLNPDMLILTGVVSELEEIIVDSVRKEIEMRVISITSNALDIVVDRYHQFSVAVGAASLVLENFFKLPVVKQ
ncbi:ROK family protein [Melioribacter roseus P3M-2]|uniref:ROK family protein n=1 Tax=Melioribacter roseus (strain DSM 23840 / JCM 17771 / VKM B-2668 / P3M-2) TaxID=1191523 RepID=I6Z6N8_MELRP|nr:ROK family protein [Melioribacter roseus]AFN74830.1 ROK family protein [Melioribacter roseus P3M-2]